MALFFFKEEDGQKVEKYVHEKHGDAAGLTNDKGWCPIDFGTLESAIHKNIHIIGDARITTGMPRRLSDLGSKI